MIGRHIKLFVYYAETSSDGDEVIPRSYRRNEFREFYLVNSSDKQNGEIVYDG